MVPMCSSQKKLPVIRNLRIEGALKLYESRCMSLMTYWLNCHLTTPQGNTSVHHETNEYEYLSLIWASKIHNVILFA